MPAMFFGKMPSSVGEALWMCFVSMCVPFLTFSVACPKSSNIMCSHTPAIKMGAFLDILRFGSLFFTIFFNPNGGKASPALVCLLCFFSFSLIFKKKILTPLQLFIFSI